MARGTRRGRVTAAALCALASVAFVTVTQWPGAAVTARSVTTTPSSAGTAPAADAPAPPTDTATRSTQPPDAGATATTVAPASVPAPAPPAAAPVVYDAADTAPGWQQRKGEAALGQIPYPWQTIGFEIKFMAARSGYRAGAFPYEKLIEVYVRQDLTVDEISRDIAHELGHALDWVHNDDVRRGSFKQIRGYGDRRGGWFACSGCTDFATPAGDFAETFAFWVLGGRLPHRGLIVAPPTQEQLDLLQPLFAV